MKQLQQLIMLAACVAVMAAVAIRRDGRIVGHELRTNADTLQHATANDTITRLDDGTIVVNTSALGREIVGYGGPVPLEIRLKSGKIESVTALENRETPGFFEEVVPLLDAWNGLTLDEAQTKTVDVVSGATYSSRAVIDNVRIGIAYAAAEAVEPSWFDRVDHSPKAIAALVVVLLGAVVPLFVRHRAWRMVQMVLNVAVLGLWCGTFLNYTLFIGALANGIDVWASLAVIGMLLVAFIYPLFGKNSHYCTHLCPLGSLQDLASKCNRKKWHLTARAVKYLTLFRQLLWAALMLLMVAGVGFEWVDYELFAAFVWQAAPTIVIGLAVVVTLLAAFVPRPYCRFVCPTGTLFKLSGDIN